jgi:hypothetical protein
MGGCFCHQARLQNHPVRLNLDFSDIIFLPFSPKQIADKILNQKKQSPQVGFLLNDPAGSVLNAD